MKRRMFLSLMGAAALTSSMMLTGCGDEIQAEELKEFPAKQYWPELAKCLEKDDLKTQLQENRMEVLWN